MVDAAPAGTHKPSKSILLFFLSPNLVSSHRGVWEGTAENIRRRGTTAFHHARLLIWGKGNRKARQRKGKKQGQRSCVTCLLEHILKTVQRHEHVG
jgi:hypothetical protein